jgi:hypothetical protein
VLMLEVDWIARTMLRPRVGDVPPAMATIGIVVAGRAVKRSGKEDETTHDAKAAEAVEVPRS